MQCNRLCLGLLSQFNFSICEKAVFQNNAREETTRLSKLNLYMVCHKFASVVCTFSFKKVCSRFATPTSKHHTELNKVLQHVISIHPHHESQNISV